MPTLVVVADARSAGACARRRDVARQVPGAQLVEVDSDHYLTLREPELLTRLLEEFLVGASGFDTFQFVVDDVPVDIAALSAHGELRPRERR